MRALAGPFLAAAVLLVAAGCLKVVDPAPLVRALRSVGVGVPPGAVRAAAAGEVVLGAAAIATGSWVAALGVALSYAAFTGFVLLALARGGVLASCGCFGKQDVPPTRTHAAVTAGLALAAAAVEARPVGRLDEVLGGSPAAGLPLLVATAAVAATCYLALAVPPPLAARRPAAARRGRA